MTFKKFLIWSIKDDLKTLFSNLFYILAMLFFVVFCVWGCIKTGTYYLCIIFPLCIVGYLLGKRMLYDKFYNK